ncbi:NAD-dependent epimerase/dehydratase family protein [Nocardiopsis xinjiangensis]|uniref:NAD-dependent epimerase/dehydratase family protein n=1 Tax=Nocardiopsis xinjiangensis TaxID=124285 RepID=UPI0003454690|nr:NAD-dependent epimerase/dehydratase family protein [Nocardiopsis xinjiangensis]
MHHPRRGAVLVTGGTGFVGSHLCRRLIGRGQRVICLDNLVTGRTENVRHLLDHPGFALLLADVTEQWEIDEPLETVFHLASAASPRDYLRMPLETLEAGSAGTRNALACAEAHGARFVLASTSEVYGDPKEHPQRETYWGHVNPVGPRSVYDEAKRYAESLTMAHHRTRDTDVGIARVFNTYGPKMRLDDGRMIPTFLRQALAGEPITVTGSGHQTRSICYVDDTVEGLLALADGDTTDPVNIGSEDEVSVLNLADHIRVLSGSRSELTFIDRPEDDPHYRRPDISKAMRLLGWKPVVHLDEGLRRTLAHVLEREVLPVPETSRPRGRNGRPNHAEHGVVPGLGRGDHA